MARVVKTTEEWRAEIEGRIAGIERTLATYTGHIGPDGEIYIRNLAHMRDLRRVVAELRLELERGPFAVDGRL